MKKIIDGKLYDTETSDELFSWDNHKYEHRELCQFRETLYRTKNGSFFLYGKGGAYSKYRVTYDERHFEGEDIIPIGEDDTKKWLRRKDGVDVFVKLFPDEVEDA